MSGRPWPEGCQCGRHDRNAWPAPVPYALTERAVVELALWDAWERQQQREQAGVRDGGA